MASLAHHRSAKGSAVAALAVLGGNAVPALAPLVPALAARLGVRTRLGAEAEAAVALTFDDGPHPQGTPAVLEVLRAERVPATFFLVGEQARRHPALAEEIVAAGHGVQLHCDRHRDQLRMTPGQIRDDMRRGEEAILDTTGRATRFYRPPYGIFSSAGLAVVRRSRWEPVLWSRWGHDWRSSASAESIAADATRDLRGGEIVLLHDADHYGDPGCWRATAAALPRIIEAVRAASLRPVAL